MLSEGGRVVDDDGTLWRVIHVGPWGADPAKLLLTLVEVGGQRRGGSMIVDPGDDVRVPRGRPAHTDA